MNREKLIKFMPKPDNKDVILYDINLKDLIDINVLEEYKKILPSFINKKNEYILLKEKIKEYEKIIDNVFLYKPSWTEEDYLQNLQNAKKTYSILYGPIKKIETNIQILQNKVKGLEEKIAIQIAKEDKEFENRKNNIDENINKNKTKLSELRNKLSFYEDDLQKIVAKIKDNEEEFELLAAMDSNIKSGEYICDYCGSKVNVYNENSRIYKRLYKNIEKNKNELEKLLQKKEQIEKEVVFYKDEISKIKIDLNNDIEFRKQDYNLYHKKSLNILKLEALRDEMINNISNLETRLKNDFNAKTEKYNELKNIIEKYELSLTNLKKIKETRQLLSKDMEIFNSLKDELKNIISKLEKYKSFISIYYKIYEQKAKEYFGLDFKFKLFSFNEYQLIEEFKVYYKDIEYNDLPSKNKKEIDKIFIEKLSIYL